MPKIHRPNSILLFSTTGTTGGRWSQRRQGGNLQRNDISRQCIAHK